MSNLEQALAGMHNGQWWGWTDSNADKVLSNVTVHDNSKTLPTQEEIDTKIAEINLNKLRMERNNILAETDWVVTMHKELGTNIPAAWKKYRQELRDITKDYTSLDDVVWPEKP